MDRDVMDEVPVSQMRPGDHLCLVYASDEERVRIRTTFVANGLGARHKVVCFVDGDGPDAVTDPLAEAGIDVGAALASGRLTVFTSAKSYLASGSLDPEDMAELLWETLAAARQAGYDGLRVVGDMGWAAAQSLDPATLLDFESRIATVFATGEAMAVCEYDARAFDPARLAGIQRAHGGKVMLDPVYEDAQLCVTHIASSSTLRLYGSVDVTNAESFGAVLRGSRPRDAELVVDAYRLDFIDVRGMRELLVAATALRAERKALVLVNAPHQLRCLMGLMGWDSAPGLLMRDWRSVA
jgi:anti-anti-sigma regulatory factor